MRDDRLGGREQLAVILRFLSDNGRLDQALAEKAEAVAIWQEIVELVESITWPAGPTGEFAKISAAYGRVLFDIVHQGWRVLCAGQRGDESGSYDREEISGAIAGYNQCWRLYRLIEANPLCPSLFRGEYFSLPGFPVAAGLDESVEHYKTLLELGGLRTDDVASVSFEAR